MRVVYGKMQNIEMGLNISSERILEKSLLNLTYNRIYVLYRDIFNIFSHYNYMRRNSLPHVIEAQSLSGAHGPKAYERAVEIVQERAMKAICTNPESLKEFIRKIQLLPENEQQDEI